MPIPETSRTSALQVAATLQRPYREGFVKNRYIARTFIMPVSHIIILFYFLYRLSNSAIRSLYHPSFHFPTLFNFPTIIFISIFLLSSLFHFSYYHLYFNFPAIIFISVFLLSSLFQFSYYHLYFNFPTIIFISIFLLSSLFHFSYYHLYFNFPIIIFISIFLLIFPRVKRWDAKQFDWSLIQ